MKKLIFCLMMLFTISIAFPNIIQAQHNDNFIDFQTGDTSTPMIITSVALGLAGTVFGVGSFELVNFLDNMQYGFGVRIPVGMIFGYETSFGLENKLYFITPKFSAPSGKYYKRLELYYKLTVIPFDVYSHRLMIRGIYPINFRFHPERPDAYKTGLSLQPLVEVGIYMLSLSEPVRFNGGSGLLFQSGSFTVGAVGNYIITDSDSVISISIEIAYFF